MFIITGGGSGIGRALSQLLAEEKYPVLIVGRREDHLLETAAFSPFISICVADVSSQEGQQEILKKVQDISQLSGLVHNAGVIEPIESIETLTPYDFQKVLATNLYAPFSLNQLLLPKLKDARILHIGSGAAHFPVKGWSAYCVSKAALWMLVQCFQLECPTSFFGSVMPGIVNTPMQQKIRESEGMASEKQAFFQNLFQNEKLISEKTVAHFLKFLLIETTPQDFSKAEWDIYDTSHHSYWLKPPHTVPPLANLQ